MSIMNTKCLKLITIPLDTGSGWNLIHWMISKIVYPILICRMNLDLFVTTSISNIMKLTIIRLHVSSKLMITNAWNYIPPWIFKPRLWQRKKKEQQNKQWRWIVRSEALYKQKLYFDKLNCQSRQHNQMQHKVSRLCPTKVYQKSRDHQGNDDSPQPYPPDLTDWWWYCCWYNRKPKLKPSKLPTEVLEYLSAFNHPDLCHEFVTMTSDYTGRFCISYPIQCIIGHVFSWTLICLTKWIHGRNL